MFEKKLNFPVVFKKKKKNICNIFRYFECSVSTVIDHPVISGLNTLYEFILK